MKERLFVRVYNDVSDNTRYYENYFNTIDKQLIFYNRMADTGFAVEMGTIQA